MDLKPTGAAEARNQDQVPPRHLEQVDRAEAMRLLGTVSLGRIVFTQHALPAVRPVNHLVEGEDIILQLHDGSALAALAAPPDVSGVVVAYEADAIDPGTHLGWSVVVTGYARPVADPQELAGYAARLRPWVGQGMSTAWRITPALITGFRLEPEPEPDPDPEPAACGG
ncbi:pyridoxamine 5'-phosphate oxidase family protein [Streptomyces sp. NPDC097981]|uniref:pyridoxamine 5'-phosphate oxidase family protein n=1 Tax=Streptomyces sp. NPDC097981 TaxID=3155428 RepID=UPI003334A2B6